MNQVSDAIVDRLAASGLTLAQAFVLDDNTLLRMPKIGRKTLRFVRSYQGPKLPLPVKWVDPRYPRIEDYYDEDGYLDYEAYDVAWEAWQQHVDYGPHHDIPDLRECWCGEPKPLPEPEGLSLADILQSLMEA